MKTKILYCLPAVLLFTSCAQDTMTGDTYSRNEARQAQSVSKGRITSIRPVKIEGDHTAGAVGGALVGGAIGSHAEQAMGSRNGIEISVRLDHGGSIAVVQEVSRNEQFQVGDRVRVLSSGGRTRVSF